MVQSASLERRPTAFMVDHSHSSSQLRAYPTHSYQAATGSMSYGSISSDGGSGMISPTSSIRFRTSRRSRARVRIRRGERRGRPHIQHEVCKIRNPSVLRSPQSLQTCEIPWGDVRLFQEAEDFALAQQGVALFSGHSATLSANTRTLTLATECLVRSDARAQDAESPQSAAFLRNPRLSLSATADRSAMIGGRSHRARIRRRSSPAST